MTAQPPPRLAFYGLGQYGLEAVRIAAERGWPIVAAYNRAGAKVGRDIGELAGLPEALGVIVQDCDTADYGPLSADVAIVAVDDRMAKNLPAYRRLLSAGVNVICHGADSYLPYYTDPVSSQEVDRLAQENGVTFTGTGIWDSSRIWSGLFLTGMATRIDSLIHRTLTDLETFSPHFISFFGAGMTVEQYAQAQKGFNGGAYRLPAIMVLTRMGLTVTETDQRAEPIVADETVHSRALGRTLEAGTVVGTRITSVTQTNEGITATSQIDLRLLPKGEREHMIWQLEGRPRASVRIDREDTIRMSSACLINRVRDVMNAPPGIRTILELGPLMPRDFLK